MALGMGCAGLIPGRHEHVYDLGMHVFFMCCIFCWTFALGYKREILPQISERTVLYFSILFMYALIVATPYVRVLQGAAFEGDYSPVLRGLLVGLCALPLFIPAYLGFLLVILRDPLGRRQEVFCYTCFLLMNVGLIAFTFAYGDLHFFFGPDRSRMLHPLDTFLTGMAFLYLALYSTYLLYLIPLTRKDQTFAERMNDIREYVKVFNDKYDEAQVSYLEGLLAVVVLGGTLLLLTKLDILRPSMVINLAIISTGTISTVLGRRCAPVPGPETEV